MTEEGCLLTPSCSGESGELARHTVFDPEFSYAVGDVTSPPDPAPGAPGIWLGIEGYSYCYLPYATTPSLIDRDVDGLRDSCELALAKAFAPLLAMDPNDDCLDGEPYWAAKYINNQAPYNFGDIVRIAYMLSYYQDCGMLGHSGDSEMIQLTVGYDGGTHHWVLFNSWLSAHATVDGTSNEYRGPLGSNNSSWGNDFQWPSGRSYSWPRVFVSRDKHANYRSLDECEGGGWGLGFFENCDGLQDMGRVRVFKDRNIGSMGHPMRDCVVSTYLPGGYSECYWSGDSFAGWQPDGTGESEAYRLFLISPVWACYMYAYGSYWCSSWGI